jgi:hypothetical protein
MLTKAQQNAMEWLESVIAAPVDFNGERQHARTIREMIGRPTMPEPLGIETEVLSDMVRAYNSAPDGDLARKWFAVYKALHARLSKPATKTVEVWRVEYAYRYIDSDGFRWIPNSRDFDGERARQCAAAFADEKRGQGDYACIRVTGPHDQEVPA